MKTSNVFIVAVLFVTNTLFGGFDSDAFIQLDSTSQKRMGGLSVGEKIVSLSEENQICAGRITYKKVVRQESYITIVIGDEIIRTSENQNFYITCVEWKRAKDLKRDDSLYTYSGQSIAIESIYRVDEAIDLIEISVLKKHNFFVSAHKILVHNFDLISIGFAFAFGEGVVEFIGCSLGLAAFGLGLKIFKNFDKNSLPRSDDIKIDLEVDPGSTITYVSQDDAQAPGMPSENDGFFPKRSWDGKKVRSPNGRGYGWPDKDGKIWVPSGPNGHGGPHWDVQDSDGNGYENIVPGGRIRGEK